MLTARTQRSKGWKGRSRSVDASSAVLGIAAILSRMPSAIVGARPRPRRQQPPRPAARRGRHDGGQAERRALHEVSCAIVPSSRLSRSAGGSLVRGRRARRICSAAASARLEMFIGSGGGSAAAIPPQRSWVAAVQGLLKDACRALERKRELGWNPPEGNRAAPGRRRRPRRSGWARSLCTAPRAPVGRAAGPLGAASAQRASLPPRGAPVGRTESSAVSVSTAPACPRAARGRMVARAARPLPRLPARRMG